MEARCADAGAAKVRSQSLRSFDEHCPWGSVARLINPKSTGARRSRREATNRRELVLQVNGFPVRADFNWKSLTGFQPGRVDFARLRARMRLLISDFKLRWLGLLFRLHNQTPIFWIANRLHLWTLGPGGPSRRGVLPRLTSAQLVQQDKQKNSECSQREPWRDRSHGMRFRLSTDWADRCWR